MGGHTVVAKLILNYGTLKPPDAYLRGCQRRWR